jgi:hypothetical protein
LIRNPCLPPSVIADSVIADLIRNPCLPNSQLSQR